MQVERVGVVQVAAATADHQIGGVDRPHGRDDVAIVDGRNAVISAVKALRQRRKMAGDQKLDAGQAAGEAGHDAVEDRGVAPVGRAEGVGDEDLHGVNTPARSKSATRRASCAAASIGPPVPKRASS